MIGMSENMSKKRKIIISVTLVTIVVLGLLLLIPVLNNTVNITKAEQAETSKLESGELFQNAYYDKKTGEVVGLTEEEQKILDKILEETQQYFKDKDIDVKIEQIANNEIEVALENVSKEQSSTLKNEVLTKLSTSIKTELGDVITDEMITSIQTDEELNKQVETEIGNYISEMGDGLDSFVKTEIVDSLDDEIEDDLTKFILSNTGKEMAQDILSGNVSDIFSNYGDVLVDSVTGGVKDLVNYKISDKIFGDVDSGLKILLGDRLDIVGKAGDIIGIDLDNVIGLQDKLIDNVAGDITGTFSNTIGGALVGDISDGITTYMDSIGQGITDSITGGLVDGIAGLGGVPGIGIEKGVQILARVENDGASPGSLIPYGDLLTNAYLFCTLHGQHIPAVQGFQKPSWDATLNDYPQWLGLPGPVFRSIEEIPEYIGQKGDAMGMQLSPLSSINAMTRRMFIMGLTAPLPYNQRATTHTLGLYTNKIKELTPVEAYVLAHNKHTGSYPDYVQKALWYVLEYLGVQAPKSPQQDNSTDNPIWGKVLSEEAMGLDDALTSLKTFTATNSGKILVDKTNYWMKNN